MKRFLVLLAAFVSLHAFARGDATPSIKFGFLSYQAAIQSMADYTMVQQKLTDLKSQYQAEAEALAPLYAKLNEVLAAIGQERGYAFILDTDVKALPFINPAMGEDINDTVKDALQ